MNNLYTLLRTEGIRTKEYIYDVYSEPAFLGGTEVLTVRTFDANGVLKDVKYVETPEEAVQYVESKLRHVYRRH